MRHIFVVGCAVAIGVLLVFYFVHRTQSSVSTKQPPEESTTIRFIGDDSAGSSESVSSVSVVGDTKRNVIVQNEQRIRDMSVPLPTDEDMQCVLNEFGVSFYHPKAWGACACDVTKGAPRGLAVACHFSVSKYYFGTLSQSFDDPNGGRGITAAEHLARLTPQQWNDPHSQEIAPRIVRQLIGGQHVFIWTDYDIGWETGDRAFAFHAPIIHPDLSSFGFIGPLSNSVDTTQNDIRNFLLVAYTWKLQ